MLSFLLQLLSFSYLPETVRLFDGSRRGEDGLELGREHGNAGLTGIHKVHNLHGERRRRQRH